jgi:putative transcriptional regulator
MTKSAFERIAEGLEEAVAIAEGKAAPAALHLPSHVDVKAIRQGLKLSQSRFAEAYGFSVVQIRDWEQGRSRPLGALRAYLTVIAKRPDDIRALLRSAA